MPIVLALVIVMHGLIHLMGPSKAFGWAELPDLRTLSPASGFAWLTAAALFFLAAALVLFAPPFPSREWWWVAALPAIALSQILIIRSWEDARYGTVANIVILIPAVIAALGAMPSAYRSTYSRLADEHIARTQLPVTVIADADLAPLPAPVQRYLRFRDVVGRPRVRNLHVRFEGSLRNGANAPWMSTVADQYSVVSPPSRLFVVHSRLFGLPFEALHAYVDEGATFQVKVASLVRIIDARGPEMTRAETVTMLNDWCLLAPASLVDVPIAWSDVRDRTARATFTNAGHTVSALLTFGDDGALVNFESDDRGRSEDGDAFENARWSTPVERYAVVDGIKVPAVAEARWSSASDEFAYARFVITSLAYNVRAPR